MRHIILVNMPLRIVPYCTYGSILTPHRTWRLMLMQARRMEEKKEKKPNYKQSHVCTWITSCVHLIQTNLRFFPRWLCCCCLIPCSMPLQFSLHFCFGVLFVCLTAKSRSCAMSVGAFVASFFAPFSHLLPRLLHRIVSAILAGSGLSHPFSAQKTSYLVVDIFKCLFLLLLFHCVDFHFVRTVFFSFVVVCNSQALDEFIFSVFHNLKIPYASFTYFIRVYNALHVHLKHISSAYQRFLALPPFVLLLPSLALFFSSFFVAALSISFKSRLKVMREWIQTKRKL